MSNQPLAPNEPKGDCYSAGERGWMGLGQRMRGAVLRPLLEFATRIQCRPDHLTLASLIFGLAFLPLWLFEREGIAIACLLIHVLLDGLDGPLARFQGSASSRGSFTDSFCDQLVVSAVTIALMLGPAKQLQVMAGALFLVLYVGVLAMAMVRNALAVPYSWLVRPRFFLYAAIPLQLGWSFPIVAVVVWVSNGLLAIKLGSGFFRLRSRL